MSVHSISASAMSSAVRVAAILFSFAAGMISPAHSDPIQGAGSTFAAPLIQEWSRDYEAARADGGDFAAPDWRVDYELVGSLGGIMRLDQSELDFAATDVPVSPAELKRRGREQFPIVMGGIAIVANLDGVAPGALRLDGPILADIYLGKILSWGDPRIRALNPDLTLPDLSIGVIHRQDGSGSTYALSQFLSAASPAWKEQHGADTLIDWPVGKGAEGTAALIAAAKAQKGTIAYADYGQAQRAQLPYAAIRNKAGLFVTPEPEGVVAAGSTVKWSEANGFASMLADATAEDAYPLSVATYAVVPVAGRPAARYHRVRDLFRLGFTQGAEDARRLGYVPLPPSLISQIESYWTNGAVAGR